MEINEGVQPEEDAGTIIFDTSSGISMEEQQEILAGINAVSMRSGLDSGVQETGAKKNGLIFPLIVNIGALVFLAAGFLLLSIFQSNDEQEIRNSSASLGLTERMMILEIRQETDKKIHEKDSQINDIRSNLSDAESEYLELQRSVDSLTETQKNRAAFLLARREEYSDSLTDLKRERTRILEDSRFIEATLRNQSDEMAFSSSRSHARRTSLDNASLNAEIEELRQLGSKQERLNMAESQMNSLYMMDNDHIYQGQLDEASDTLQLMKEFLDSPVFQGTYAYEMRRKTHLTAISGLEEAVNRLKSGPAYHGQVHDDTLRQRNAALEQRMQDLEKELAASNEIGAEQRRIITRHERTITSQSGEIRSLETRNSQLRYQIDAERALPIE